MIHVYVIISHISCTKLGSFVKGMNTGERYNPPLRGKEVFQRTNEAKVRRLGGVWGILTEDSAQGLLSLLFAGLSPILLSLEHVNGVTRCGEDFY